MAFVDDVGVLVDRDADVPVGVQLAWALRGAILSGAVQPGDRLPPLRELAEEVGVNPNTLRAVYARLEADGLIESRHGSGTFVTGPGNGRELSRLVAAAARAAHDAGVDRRDLAAALYVNVTGAAHEDSAAHRRRLLREEIAVLERVLARLPAPARDEPDPHGRGPRLLTLEELEETRDALVATIAQTWRPPEPEDDEPDRPAPKRQPARALRPGPATA